MTRAVGDDKATIASLDEVASLFDQAQTSGFNLMASVSLSLLFLSIDYAYIVKDSVPKFLREPKYLPDGLSDYL
jgi:hypothetical protein